MISENTSSMSSLVRAILGGENINVKVTMCDREESSVTQELSQIIFSAAVPCETAAHAQERRRTHAVNPLIMCAYLMSTRSSQPHRLFLPVVTPTSVPRVCRSSPTSWRQQSRGFWQQYSNATTRRRPLHILHYEVDSEIECTYIIFED